MNSRITPSEPFPEDLNVLMDSEVEVLNSKLHRELDHEYVHEDGSSPETESRLEQVTEELDFRDLVSESPKDAPTDQTPADPFDLMEANATDHAPRTTTRAAGPDSSEPGVEHHAG
ncbi:hypothetical protein V6S67_09745 [Arthrobacter sp. Soc17.1.1.1]|uniref:hypothetical protein n=1 Tax=Arthrobacter sp. Soc17.1.1.1 TaxID=3121277 RepID=UPI002FE4B4C9